MFKPVDLQSFIPRSYDVQKVQAVHQNRPNLERHDFAREMMQQTQERQGQVQKTEQSGDGNKVGRETSGEK